eukprot:SAG11_NODE_422_length_9597_cov_11.289488_5_plen_156_part_00
MLWLTEVAAGSNNLSYVTDFATALLDKQTGLTNRELFPCASEKYYSLIRFTSMFVQGRAYITSCLHVITSCLLYSAMRCHALPCAAMRCHAQYPLTHPLRSYVEKVSWFSEYSFGSFTVGNYTPAPNEVWKSSLFSAYGSLSPVGEAFFGGCQQQ